MVFSFGIIVLALVLFGIGLNKLMFSLKRYPSPEEALINYRNHVTSKVVKVIEDEDVAIILYKQDMTLMYEYAKKDENGWQISLKDFNYTLLNKVVARYNVNVMEVGEKYVLRIEPLKFSGVTTPKDSLNSTFEYFELKLEGMVLRHWYLILDEIPEDYIIYIEDTEIKVVS